MLYFKNGLKQNSISSVIVYLYLTRQEPCYDGRVGETGGGWEEPRSNEGNMFLLLITCGYQCDKAVNKIHTITSPFVKPKIIRSLLKTVEHHPSYSEDCRNLTEDA